MTLGQRPHVGKIALLTLSVAKFLDEGLNIRRRKQRLVERFDVGRSAVGHHVGWERGLNLTLSDKENDRVESFVGQSEIFGKALGVSVILMQRVLESEFVSAWKRLGPLIIAFIPEDPAIEILSFNDKYSIDRNEDVIDLGGAVG